MNNIEDVTTILSTCSTMKEASNALKVNERTLRKWFKRFGLPNPSTFLNTKINAFIASTELTEEDKSVIKSLYPAGLSKGYTVDELSAKLGKSKTKIRQFIKDANLKHDGISIQPTVFDQKKINEEIKDFLDISLKKNTEDKITDSIRKDAEKWRNWKNTTGKELFELLSKKVPQYKVEKRVFEKTERKYAAILALQDFHYGRLSSLLETFDACSPQEQEKLLFDALEDIFSKIDGFGTADKIYITVGGDFINSDNSKLTTTNGTQQDSIPSHAHIMVNAGFLLVKIVDFCRTYFKEVELIPTPGNHDRDSTIGLYMFLYAWFKDEEDVICDGISLVPRQYRTYSNTLLAFLHGDGGKVQDWPIIMANEASEMWGKTKHRILVQGHFHHRINQDLKGVQRIQVPSMASEDRYSTLHGYQSKKGLSIILIDSKRGYFGELFANCS